MAEGITVIAGSTTAPKLPDGVIASESLKAEVDGAPGVAAYVHYNGPTDQLATLCSGMAVLDPGASPHPPHQHAEEETMVIASGTGEMEVDGKKTQVGPGAVMYTAAWVWHGIVNTGDTPLVFYWSKWIAKGFEQA